MTRRPPTRSPVTSALLVAVLLAASLVVGPATVAAQQPASRERLGHYRPDDWITIADFRYVSSVAVSAGVASFGTTAGVERFDTLRGVWRSPVTTADGLPDGRVTALAADPAGGDQWVGTARGMVRIDAFSGEAQAVWGPPPTRVSEIRVDPDDGSVYAFVAGGWWVGRGGSPVLERAGGPPPVRARGSIPVDRVDPLDLPWSDPEYVRSDLAGGRLFRLTTLDRDARGDWYVGTWGDNGRRWGAGRQSWEPLRFGLGGPGGGPIVRGQEGTWFVPGGGRDTGLRALVGAAPQPEAPPGLSAAVSAGDPTPLALAYAGDDGSWRYQVQAADRGFPAAGAAAAVAVGDTLYLGSDHGLTRLVPSPASDGMAATTWGWREDRPLGRIAALAADGGILWLGSEAGLVRWDLAGETAAAGRHLAGRHVRAILSTPEALFAGTDEGLFVGRRGPATAVPDSFTRARTLGRGVRALAKIDTLLLAATDAGLEVFDLATGERRVTAAGAGRIPGEVVSLAADSENVWVGTTEALVRWRPATGEWQTYTPADGLAGAPVLHLMVEPGAVWASTPHGVTRFGWREADR